MTLATTTSVPREKIDGVMKIICTIKRDLLSILELTAAHMYDSDVCLSSYIIIRNPGYLHFCFSPFTLSLVVLHSGEQFMFREAVVRKKWGRKIRPDIDSFKVH